MKSIIIFLAFLLFIGYTVFAGENRTFLNFCSESVLFYRSVSDFIYRDIRFERGSEGKY